MTLCHICNRAMVSNPSHLPVPICKRARCKPERDWLLTRYTKEWHQDHYQVLEDWG